MSDRPFDQLVQQEVMPASTMARQISDSPSAVAIVTAEDIRAYGYRTIADVINSMRGLYTTYDRHYQYIGGRGFGVPGDYTGRIMLLIDGYATQDPLFNQAYIDESGLLDLELVERVEYVPGTGSVIYGNNALLGIINIVTRKGADFSGTQLAGERWRHGGEKQRATFGKRFDNGADLLLSASRLREDGQDLYFPAYDQPENNRGIADGLDWRKADRFFGKFSFDGLTVEGGYVDYRKMVPTNPTAVTRFNTPYLTRDENAFVQVRYETDLSLVLQSVSSFYAGRYRYENAREFDVPNPAEVRYADRAYLGQWWGLDQKFVGRWFTGHSLLFGFEFRNDGRQTFERRFHLGNGALDSSDFTTFSRRTGSFYLTDEYQIDDRWSAHAGFRYDHASDGAGNWSPRLALIYRPGPLTTWKASYSEAFRLPNAYERWSNGDVSRPEHVAASELVLQHAFSSNLRLTGSLYRYRLRDAQYDDAQAGSRRSHGFEAELEGKWPSGLRLRTSLAWQDARDGGGQDLVNSPDWLGKFNLTFPLPGTGVRAGVETQYLGSRLTREQRRLGSVTLNHLTFSSESRWHGVSAAFSIRNLFDRRYQVVAPFERTLQDSLRMDGRSYWLQLAYDF